MTRKINFKSLIVCIAIPLFIGGLSALFTMGSMDDFAALNQPPLSPPGWLFPVVWTVLYILMGIASYLVLETSSSDIKKKNACSRVSYQLTNSCLSDCSFYLFLHPVLISRRQHFIMFLWIFFFL